MWLPVPAVPRRRCPALEYSNLLNIESSPFFSFYTIYLGKMDRSLQDNPEKLELAGLGINHIRYYATPL